MTEDFLARIEYLNREAQTYEFYDNLKIGMKEMLAQVIKDVDEMIGCVDKECDCGFNDLRERLKQKLAQYEEALK